MKNHNPHKRSEKFSLAGSLEDAAGQDRPDALEIILFADDAKLRSHTVKHLTDPMEAGRVWKNILPPNVYSASDLVSKLKAIGCPFFHQGFHSPPCKGCPGFERCTHCVSSLEAEYISAIRQTISQTSALPRYALAHSVLKKVQILSLLSDSCLVLKAAEMKNGAFNFMTCYAKTGTPFARLLKNQTDRILLESGNCVVKWHSPALWGFGAEKTNTPYRKAGPGNWRQYLDQNLKNP